MTGLQLIKLATEVYARGRVEAYDFHQLALAVAQLADLQADTADDLKLVEADLEIVHAVREHDDERVVASAALGRAMKATMRRHGIEWDEVPGATEYRVYHNGELVVIVRA